MLCLAFSTCDLFNFSGEEKHAIKPAVIIPMAPLILEAANKGERYANRYQTPMNIVNENNVPSELVRQLRAMPEVVVNPQYKDSLENVKQNPILAYLLKNDEPNANKTRGQSVVRRKITHQQTLYGPMEHLRTFYTNPQNPQQGEGSVQNVGQFFSPEPSFLQTGSPTNDYPSPPQTGTKLPTTSQNSQEKSPSLSVVNGLHKDNPQESGVHVHTTMNIFPVISPVSQPAMSKFNPIVKNLEKNDFSNPEFQSRISWPWSGYFPIVIQDPATAIYSAFTSMVEYGPEADVCGGYYGEDERKKNKKQQRRRGRMMNQDEVKESDDEETMDVGDLVTQFVLRKGGVAIAGPGGTAATGDGGTAVVGPGGIVYARPNGLAVVGPGGKVVSLPAGVSEPRSVGLPLPQGAKIVATGPIVYYHRA